MELHEKNNPSASNFSYEVKEEINYEKPTELQDYHLTSFGTSKQIDSRILCIRGKIDGKEVLMIDTDQDSSFLDEKVHYLPDLEISDSIDYNQKYLYKTEVAIDETVRFKELCHQLEYTQEKNIFFSVSATYDSLEQSLSYMDKIRYGFRNIWYLNYRNIFSVKFSDRFSWQDKVYSYEVTSLKDTIVYQYSQNQFFSIQENIYSIDTFVFCSSQVLITNHHSDFNEVSVIGRSILNDKNVDISKSNTNFKIVHIWGPWCLPCVQRFPQLVELASIDGISLFGIAVDERKEKVTKSAAFKSTTWEHAYYSFDDFKNQLLFPVGSYPTYYLYDKENRFMGKFTRLKQLKRAMAIN